MKTKSYYTLRKFSMFALVFLTVLLVSSLWLIGQAFQVAPENRLLAFSLFTSMNSCFAWGVWHFAQELRRPRPTLTLDADGIRFRRDISGVGHIPWSQIRGTRTEDRQVNNFGRTRYLIIVVEEPEALINSVPSKTTQFLMRANAFPDSPVWITGESFSEPIDAVQIAIENHLYERRNAQEATQSLRQPDVSNAEPLRVGNR